VPIPVILDCDPGTDDALAILLALASPELSVLAITVASLPACQPASLPACQRHRRRLVSRTFPKDTAPIGSTLQSTLFSYCSLTTIQACTRRRSAQIIACLIGPPAG
jgi:hypothetical protein